MFVTPSLAKGTRMTFTTLLSRTLLALAALGLLSMAVAQQDCPRGELDARFCDTDGDMLADPPTDPSQWVTPSTLIFTYAPTEDPAVYQDAFQEFMDYLAEVTGIPVQWFSVRSYAAQIEAMRAGRLHVAGFAAGAVQEGVNLAGFHPVAMMAQDEGDGTYTWGYEMEIIVRAGSDIQTLEDLEGRQLAFVSPTSNSGFKAPAALLYAELGLKPDEGYQTAFSGGHDNSILGVSMGDYEAAAIASSVLRRAVARGDVTLEEFDFVYTSDTFPSTAYGHAHNLHPDLVEKIREAYLTFDWSGTALDETFLDVNTFIEISYQDDWEVLRTIAAASAEIE
jgi:phosphonate transport system substrate-binding protein